MQDKTYNGWTNYATWRVNLELFDSFDPREYFTDGNGKLDKSELADNLMCWADEAVIGGHASLLADYARAFPLEVNWHEIAEHMVADYCEEGAA